VSHLALYARTVMKTFNEYEVGRVVNFDGIMSCVGEHTSRLDYLHPIA